MAIVLTKQFTYALRGAPDPAKASRHFDQLLDKLLESGAGPRLWPTDDDELKTLARLLGSSDFLWEDFLRMQFESLTSVLGDVRGHPLRNRAQLQEELARATLGAPDHAEARNALNRLRDREVFLIDMKHLLDPGLGIESFSNALSDLAEAVLETSLAPCLKELARRPGPLRAPAGEGRFAICGLGKLGGRELGYASDIELLFVCDGPPGREHPPGMASGDEFGRLAEEIVAFIESQPERLFDVDLRLRPFGREGPLVSTLPQIRNYYREGGEADPFERQALIKLRFIAGDHELGRAVEEHRDRFTYSGAPWDIPHAVHVRERQSRELVRPGEVNLKYSPGGLLDVEYAVQYLQILEGSRRPELRTPATLIALTGLGKAGLLSAAEHDALRGGYVFLRRAIEALRMVRGQSGDTVLPPAGSEEPRFLARRLGYSGVDWDDAAQRFRGELSAHMEAVAGFYDRRFGRLRGVAHS